MTTEQFFGELDQLFAAKRMTEVELFLKRCLNDAETSGDNFMAISCLNELGGYLRYLTRFDEGIGYLKKALKLLEDMEAQDSEHYGTTLINYATTLNLAGNFDEALKAYHDAADVFKRCGIKNDYRLATIYNNITYMYQAKGDYQNAKASLMKALDILTDMTDTEIEVATTYSNMAAVCLKSEDIDEAETYAAKAIRIFNDRSGDSDVHYSAAVCVMAQIQMVKGQLKDAVDTYTEAMRLLERDYGSANANYKAMQKSRELCINLMNQG